MPISATPRPRASTGAECGRPRPARRRRPVSLRRDARTAVRRWARRLPSALRPPLFDEVERVAVGVGEEGEQDRPAAGSRAVDGYAAAPQLVDDLLDRARDVEA